MRRRVVAGAVGLGCLALSVSGCVSGAGEQQHAEDANAALAQKCDLTDQTRLELQFGVTFTSANLITDENGEVTCQWASTDSMNPAFVRTTYIEGGGKKAFDKQLKLNQKESGLATATTVPGVKAAFLVPLTKSIGMLSGKDFVLVTAGLSGVSQADLTLLAQRVAEQAAG